MGRSIKNCLFRREISSHGFQLDFFLPRGLTETSERKAFTSLKQWVPKPIHLPGSNLETLPASSDNKARQHPMSWRLAPDSNILSFVEKFRLWNQFRGQILTSYVSSTFCVWRGYRPPPHGGAVKGHREGNWPCWHLRALITGELLPAKGQSTALVPGRSVERTPPKPEKGSLPGQEKENFQSPKVLDAQRQPRAPFLSKI